ncbi:hypothetical protein ABMA70_05055 [Halobacteriovorax sp. XZX-3]|uniref:ComEC/Rec2 family competence protein n=1 Tax=unclassified Halobacteriovorax TaxID=2639665 RepID=UPI0037191F20
MSKVHFLNVGDGDCSIIEHNSGRNTMIDINKGGIKSKDATVNLSDSRGVSGNFNQKANPTDPLEFMVRKSINQLFRFILTHPDMDHMGGLAKLLNSVDVSNFWDTKNNKEIDTDSWDNSPYAKEDWDAYQAVRSGKYEGLTYLCLNSGATGTFYNEGSTVVDNGDGLYILAPTSELVEQANTSGDFNDCSYVILYLSAGFKMIFAGDSENKTWDHILENWNETVKDVDVLIAPHHGRKSDRKWDFIDVLKPKLVLIGNAPSEYIAYDKYKKYGSIITNNQAGDITLEFSSDSISIYVANKSFAEKFENSFYSNVEDAYYIGCVAKIQGTSISLLIDSSSYSENRL